MKLVIFGTVIRTRRSLGEILRQAAREGRTETEYFAWGVHTYNTGIFGLLFYRVNRRRKHKEFFT